MRAYIIIIIIISFDPCVHFVMRLWYTFEVWFKIWPFPVLSHSHSIDSGWILCVTSDLQNKGDCGQENARFVRHTTLQAANHSKRCSTVLHIHIRKAGVKERQMLCYVVLKSHSLWVKVMTLRRTFLMCFHSALWLSTQMTWPWTQHAVCSQPSLKTRLRLKGETPFEWIEFVQNTKTMYNVSNICMAVCTCGSLQPSVMIFVILKSKALV
jgi:hypothetical protein